MDTTLLFILIILIASTLQTATGFGFSILATPFLLFLFEPVEAIQINLICSLFISIALFWKIKNSIDVGNLIKFIIGSVVGLPIGIFILLLLDVSKLKLIIGIIILVLTFALLFKLRIKQTKTRDLIIGGFSGTFTTSIGMPGPPLLLYFSGTDTKKEEIRATTLAFYLFIYLVSLGAQIIFIGTNTTIWISSLYALPLVGIGLLLGQFLFNKVSQRHFRFISYIILLFTAIFLLIFR